jgi:hypothetical protein
LNDDGRQSSIDMLQLREAVLFENMNHLGRCAFVESQRASEAGFAIDPLIV